MRRVLLAAAAMTMMAGTALAQQMAQATPPAAPASGPDATGVVHPESKVDPGMKVIRPKLPPGSTPVIKPGSTTPGGTVVVPR